MASRNLFSRSVLALAVVVPTVLAEEADAAMAVRPMSISQAQLVYGGCGAGWRRTVFGGCTRVNQPRFKCQPGFHKVPAPTTSGYRCVMNGY